MKKLLFFTVFALTAMNLSASEQPKKTGLTDVAKAIGRYVWNNPVKCTIATILAVDLAIHGYESSIAQNAVKFAQESGKQALADGKIIQSAAQGAMASAQNAFAAIRMKIS